MEAVVLTSPPRTLSLRLPAGSVGRDLKRVVAGAVRVPQREQLLVDDGTLCIVGNGDGLAYPVEKWLLNKYPSNPRHMVILLKPKFDREVRARARDSDPAANALFASTRRRGARGSLVAAVTLEGRCSVRVRRHPAHSTTPPPLLRWQEPAIRITCLKNTGQEYEVNMRKAASVVELKWALAASLGVPSDLMKLIFAGRRALLNEHLLSHHGLQDGRVVHLVLQLRGD